MCADCVVAGISGRVIYTQMSRQPTYQWYQNGAVVTASIQLRPSEERGEVTADFKEEYCVIYDRGKLFQCFLYLVCVYYWDVGFFFCMIMLAEV